MKNTNLTEVVFDQKLLDKYHILDAYAYSDKLLSQKLEGNENLLIEMAAALNDDQKLFIANLLSCPFHYLLISEELTEEEFHRDLYLLSPKSKG